MNISQNLSTCTNTNNGYITVLKYYFYIYDYAKDWLKCKTSRIICFTFLHSNMVKLVINKLFHDIKNHLAIVLESDWIHTLHGGN